MPKKSNFKEPGIGTPAIENSDMVSCKIEAIFIGARNLQNPLKKPSLKFRIPTLDNERSYIEETVDCTDLADEFVKSKLGFKDPNFLKKIEIDLKLPNNLKLMPCIEIEIVDEDSSLFLF